MTDPDLLNTLESNFEELIKSKEIDFIDFGCSKGGSIDFAQRRFGGLRGLGIDIDEDKVKQTRAAGYNAIKYDIKSIPDNKLVRFTIMSHMLEHVPLLSDVKDFIRKACNISNEFVYIQQPFFDSDSYLFERGLKLFWSDWSGHPNRMTSLELWVLLRDLKNEGLPIEFSIYAYKSIEDSHNSAIHPLSSQINQHAYEINKYQEKPEVIFSNNVFHDLVCLITMPGINHSEIVKKIRFDKTLIDVDGNPGLVFKDKEISVNNKKPKNKNTFIHKVFMKVKRGMNF